MNEVILVTAGTYSSYHVECAAPDVETAEAIAAALNEASAYNEASVETFPIRTAAPRVERSLHMTAGITVDGEVLPEKQYAEREGFYGKEFWPEDAGPDRNKVNVLRYVTSGYQWFSDGTIKIVRLQVDGYDYERVRKVFSEQLAEAVAMAPVLISAEEARARLGP